MSKSYIYDAYLRGRCNLGLNVKNPKTEELSAYALGSVELMNQHGNQPRTASDVINYVEQSVKGT